MPRIKMEPPSSPPNEPTGLYLEICVPGVLRNAEAKSAACKSRIVSSVITADTLENLSISISATSGLAVTMTFGKLCA